MLNPRTNDYLQRTPVFISQSRSTQNTANRFHVRTGSDVEKELKNNPQAELVRTFLDQDRHILRFTPTELKALTELFYSQCDLDNNTAMSMGRFCETVGIANTFPVAGEACDNPLVVDKDEKSYSLIRVMTSLFEQLDENSDGQLDLKEFLVGFSFWRERIGSTQDKFEFLFLLFDDDRSNSLNLQEFERVVAHILAADSTCLQEFAEVPPEISQVVEMCFEDADKNNDGNVSLAEFTAWALKNGGVLERLGTCVEAIHAVLIDFDSNKDETLDKQEFSNLLLLTSSPESARDQARARLLARTIFDKLDVNGTKELSLTDFKQWILTHNLASVVGIDHVADFDIVIQDSNTQINAFSVGRQKKRGLLDKVRWQPSVVGETVKRSTSEGRGLSKRFFQKNRSHAVLNGGRRASGVTPGACAVWIEE